MDMIFTALTSTLSSHDDRALSYRVKPLENFVCTKFCLVKKPFEKIILAKRRFIAMPFAKQTKQPDRIFDVLQLSLYNYNLSL